MIGPIFVFCVFFILGILSIYVCLICFRFKLLSGNADDDGEAAVSTAEKGLDSTVIQTFPVFVYSDVKNHKKEINAKGTILDCVVCLAEYEDEDVLRLLPKCHHVFHRECTDGWFKSHSTRPVCRSDLNGAAGSAAELRINVTEDAANHSGTNPSQTRIGSEGIRTLDPEPRLGRSRFLEGGHNQNNNPLF
ncbi:hypothetical protein MKW94_023779 [Papaver nudicaule]|uniref:RING-type E3 ubiquitin transferase n=1 Tax=Papaver nudicaule TaxID=74823 RepID=A0AA41SKS3_PAPNU|nr:hypothetical protein [Papaver nudicaule]